jgi:hypothetical protein
MNCMDCGRKFPVEATKNRRTREANERYQPLQLAHRRRCGKCAAAVRERAMAKYEVPAGERKVMPLRRYWETRGYTFYLADLRGQPRA